MHIYHRINKHVDMCDGIFCFEFVGVFELIFGQPHPFNKNSPKKVYSETRFRTKFQLEFVTRNIKFAL